MEKVKKNEPIRNYYIVRLILNTGLRISELLSIELSDIDLKRKNLKIVGKGSKQRNIPLNDKAIEIIKLVIDDRKNYRYAYEVLGSKYLFLSNKSEKLKGSTINRIFNNYSNHNHIDLARYYIQLLARLLANKSNKKAIFLAYFLSL